MVHVALLRGINVGGAKRVAMGALRELAASLGLRDVRTLLQSGNLVFESDGRKPAALERALEEEIARRLRMPVEVVIRTSAEWGRVVANNPFSEQAATDPGHLLVMAMKAAVQPRTVEVLRAAVKGRELVAPGRRELYLVYPDGVGRSKLTGAVIEKTLGSHGTARNWNTVLKLAAEMDAIGSH